MISVGTRELKNNLSRYIGTVRKGEDIIITVHGRAVARIIPEPGRKDSLQNRLAALAAEGLVELPKAKAGKAGRHRIPGKPVSAVITEERR